MILHGIERPNIRYADTLSKKFEQKSQYDVVFANPPFTGSIDKSDINDAFKLNTAKTELLFLELFYNLLGVGGRAAVIVPEGVLFGSSNTHVQARRMLLEKCQLEAVISMPPGVFQPYTGVSTAVLVFVKGGKTENVWFYEIHHDGFDLGATRKPVKENDLPDLVNKWDTKPESANSWWASVESIKDNGYNLSAKQYNPHQISEVEYIDIEGLLEELIQNQTEILAELKNIKNNFS